MYILRNKEVKSGGRESRCRLDKGPSNKARGLDLQEVMEEVQQGHMHQNISFIDHFTSRKMQKAATIVSSLDIRYLGA